MTDYEDLHIPIGYPTSDLNPNGDPLLQQELFHTSWKKFRMMEGGWGTGKTTAICLELSADIKIPNNYILFGRKDLQEFKSTTLKEFLDIYDETIDDHNKSDRTIKFQNGTIIYYTNLDDARDALNKIASLNLGAAVVDQCEEISRMMFETIKGRLRRKDTRRCFYGAANPNGHDWIWEDFFELPYTGYARSLNFDLETAESIVDELDSTYYMRLVETYKTIASRHNLTKDQIQLLHKKSSYEGWIATSLDNPYLPNDTLQMYLNLPDQVKRRYVYCSFDDFTGEVYSTYSDPVNKIPYYVPTEYEKKYIVLDYGYRNPTAVGFFAVDYDGVARMYDELYLKETLIKDVADEIKKIDPHYQTSIKLADPSMFNVQRDGRSVGDDYQAEGIIFQPAENDVSQGIQKVNQLLKDGTIQIGENCVKWFWERDRYKWKDLKTGQERNEYEEPVKKNDHMMDLTRYFANYIYAPVKEKPPEKKSHREEAFEKSRKRDISDFNVL